MPAFTRLVLAVSVCLLVGAAGAFAQLAEPPGPFVLDARGAFSSVGRSEPLATPRGLTVGELPKSILGAEVGAHFYPLRRKVTIGVGASLLMLGGTQRPGAPATGAVNPPLTPGEFRVRGIVPQVSLNFGSSRGWSYLGGGLGFSQLKAGRAESELAYGPQLLTLNIGGGARWFVSEHVAFTLDGRYHRIAAKALEASYVGNPLVTMFVLSAGVGFK